MLFKYTYNVSWNLFEIWYLNFLMDSICCLVSFRFMNDACLFLACYNFLVEKCTFKVIFCKVSTITNEKLSMSFTFNIQLLKHPQHNKDFCVQYIRMLENSAHLCTKGGWIGKYGGCRTKGTVEARLQSWSINTSSCAHSLRESDSGRGGDAHDSILLASVVPTATRNWAAVIVRPYSCPSLAHLQQCSLWPECYRGTHRKLQHWPPQRHLQESYDTEYHGGICRTLPPPASSLMVVQLAIQDPRYEGIAHHPSAPGSGNYDACGSRAAMTL